MKKYLSILKHTAIVVVYTTLLSVLFAYLLSFIAVYCVIPNIAFIIPGLEKALTEMSDQSTLPPLAVEIGMLAGFIPAASLVFTALHYRRSRFIDETDGIITPKAGLESYVKSYAKTDLIPGTVLVILDFTPLPSPFRLLYHLGILPGMLLSAIFAICVYLYAVKKSLAKWRAEYFYSGAR